GPPPPQHFAGLGDRRVDVVEPQHVGRPVPVLNDRLHHVFDASGCAPSIHRSADGVRGRPMVRPGGPTFDYRLVRLFSYAQIAISTRFRAPSLAIRLAMCVFTVLSVMYNSRAISLLVRPLAPARSEDT